MEKGRGNLRFTLRYGLAGNTDDAHDSQKTNHRAGHRSGRIGWKWTRPASRWHAGGEEKAAGGVDRGAGVGGGGRGLVVFVEGAASGSSAADRADGKAGAVCDLAEIPRDNLG